MRFQNIVNVYAEQPGQDLAISMHQELYVHVAVQPYLILWCNLIHCVTL